jgi:hypothetical protein
MPYAPKSLGESFRVTTTEGEVRKARDALIEQAHPSRAATWTRIRMTDPTRLRRCAISLAFRVAVGSASVMKEYRDRRCANHTGSLARLGLAADPRPGVFGARREQPLVDDRAKLVGPGREVGKTGRRRSERSTHGVRQRDGGCASR